MKKQYSRPEDLYKTPFPELTPLAVKCPGCGETISSDQINIHQNLAKCTNCTTLYQLNEALPLRNKPEEFMPKGVDVLHLTNELDIEISWRRSMSTFLVFFTIVWNSIVFIVAAGAILSGNFSALLFMSFHLFIGISLLYYHLTLIFNHTNILVDDRRMHIDHYPLRLPFYPKRNIEVDRIKQLYVEKYVESTTNDIPNYAYSVTGLLDDGKKLKLIKGLMHLDQARYIEQEIENFLHITDKKMTGEYHGEKEWGSFFKRKANLFVENLPQLVFDISECEKYCLIFRYHFTLSKKF